MAYAVIGVTMARPRKSKKSTTLESYNPATGEPLGTVPLTSPEEVVEVLARARRAQRRWASLAPGERGARLREFSETLLNEADDVCARISAENGKTRQEALVTEVLPTVDLANYYGKRKVSQAKEDPVASVQASGLVYTLCPARSGRHHRSVELSIGNPDRRNDLRPDRRKRRGVEAKRADASYRRVRPKRDDS